MQNKGEEQSKLRARGRKKYWDGQKVHCGLYMMLWGKISMKFLANAIIETVEMNKKDYENKRENKSKH